MTLYCWLRSGSDAILCGLIVVLLLNTPLDGRAQAPPTQHVRTQWTAVEEGMPSNGVRNVLQTEDGYVWLGTEGGLARFDGVAFEETWTTRLEAEVRTNDRILDVQGYGDGLLVLYRSRDLVHYHDGEARAVTDSVWTHFVGTEGRVWIGADDGVSVYRNGRLDPVAPQRMDAQVRGLLRTDDGTLWVGTKTQGLYRRTPDGTITHLTTNDGLLANKVATFSEDDGTVLVGTASGLQRWDDGTLTEIAPVDPSAASLQIVKVQGDVDGTCWARATQGVYRCRDEALVPYKNSTRGFQPRPKYISADFAQEGPDGHLFVNAGRTLYRDGTPIFETEFAIRSVTHDREGTLWIGTDTRGLFQLRPSTFTVYGDDEGIPNSNVTTIARRQDRSVWIGTRSGHLVDFREGEPHSSSLRKAGRPLRPIFAIHEGRAGQLWVGGTRLCRIEDGQCARPEGAGPIPRTLITSIQEDQQGRLWVGTLGKGLWRESTSAGADAGGTQFTPQNSALASREVRWLHESPTGTLWIATIGGGGGELARYRDGQFEVMPDTVLSVEHPSFLHQDTTGVLWLGTTESGLARIDLRGADSLAEATVTTYRKRDGLYRNTIYQVIPDEQGRLWISTSNGIFWVKKSALEAVARGEQDRVQSVVYTTRDGMRNVEGNGFGGPGAVQGPDGRLWFPNQEGATVVDPHTVKVEATPPRMHVEAVVNDDHLVTDRPGAAVSLTENQRTFHIEYTGIRLSDPQAIEFRYRLVGLEDEWVHAESRREAFFTEVPPGQYTFEVVGRTRNGPWSAEPARLTVTVAPFFYETWWFVGVCALLVGMAVVGGVRYRFYALRRRKEELNRKVETRTQELEAAKEEAERAKETTEEALATVEEQAEQLRRLDEMKSRFFANVSHELRTPLSLMIGPVQQLLDQDEGADQETEMLQIVRRNAERLQHLVEQLLDLARYDAGRLDLAPQRQEWAAFVEQVTQRFAPMAEAEGVTLSTDVSSAARPAVFDPNRMETILSNLLRNALTYTPEGGTVTVRANVGEEEASLVVTDTGPGIPPREQEALFDRFTRGVGQSQRGGTGIGLALTKALVTLHDGTIAVDSTPGEGSTFTVRWPRGGSGRTGEEVDAVADWTPREPVYRGDGPGTAGEASSTDDAETPGDAAPPDRTTVLVVDDNADVRRYVRSLLEPRYRVLEAENGRNGLQQIRTTLPDLVVADVMMPELDGFEMVRDLRQSARTDCIPVVMLTARAEEADQIEGLEGGAEAYVTKPFDADVLTAQVDRLIATRRQLRERFDGGNGAAGADEQDETATFEECVRAIVANNLTDPSFSVEDLAEEVGLARRTVTRKVKAAFGRTPSQLIRAMRVERGAELLTEEVGTVSEVAYASGFNSLSYFSRSFKEHFGVPPSAYQKREA